MLEEGIGRGSEVEEDIDPVYARSFVENPQKLYTLQSDMLQAVLR